MNLAWINNRSAWQPLTFAGVAAFATASLKRLLLVQFIFALLAAATAVWFLDNAWFPTIREAILQLPERGEVRAGKLDWSDETPRLLADGHFLAFISDLKHTGQIRVPAQIQVEFGRHEVRVLSLFGYADFPYPAPGWILIGNRTELLPWWGAWRPPILWLTFGGVIVALMLTWAILASAYCLPIWLAGYFSNRELSLKGSWKLCGAALMPGALLMVVAILTYGLGLLDLVQFVVAMGAHFLVGLIYSFASLMLRPKFSMTAASPTNPFTAATSIAEEPSSTDAKNGCADSADK